MDLEIKNPEGIGFNLGPTQGPRGYSAYEIAVQNGYEGTEQEWLDSLKGASYVITEQDKQDIVDELEPLIYELVGVIDTELATLTTLGGGE